MANNGYARKYEIELQKIENGVTTTLTYTMIMQFSGSMKVVPATFSAYISQAALAADTDANYLAKVNAFLAAIPNMDETRKTQLAGQAQYADTTNCPLPVVEELPAIVGVLAKLDAVGCWTGMARVDFGDGKGYVPPSFMTWAGTEYEQEVFDRCFILSANGNTCQIPVGYGGGGLQ